MQAHSKVAKAKGVNGDSEAVGPRLIRANPPRQQGTGNGSKSKERNSGLTSDRVSATPKIVGTPQESLASSSSTNDSSKRLPNFTKSKRLRPEGEAD